MRDLIGKYNRNRKVIWFILGICVAVYVIIHIINEFLGQDLYRDANNLNLTTNNTFYDTNYSVVSNEQIEKKYVASITNIIKEFINNCNENKSEEAYNMLSSECKEELYPNIETFEKEYLNKFFTTRKTYKMQAWITNENKYIYRIEFIEDMLSSGSSTNTKKIDYYTVIKDGDNYYLNINGFIEKNEINKYSANELAKITVLSEEVFIDCVYLNVEIENKTTETILIDEGKKGDSVYLKDTKDIGYASFLFEEPEENLIVKRKSKKEFKIKFEKEYSTNITIKEIGFLDIVINYKTEYEKNNQKLVVKIYDK